jgi:alkylation response protein AidB-like acyl-CoA dehydrogenase
VCEEALRLTAEYTKTRKQFDQPIAMFQAVGHRAANAYIDTEGIRLTAWQACWRLAAGERAG